MLSRSRSSRISKIIEKPSIGLRKKTYEQAMQELDLAYEEALQICESDWEKLETHKRYLEHRLHFAVVRSDDRGLALKYMMSILGEDSFDLERTRHVLRLAILGMTEEL